MDKITMKIFRDVYKRLQLVKIEQELVSLSDAIKYLLDNQKDK